VPLDRYPAGFFQSLKSSNFFVMAEAQRPKRGIAESDRILSVPSLEMQSVQFSQHSQKSTSRLFGQFQQVKIVVPNPVFLVLVRSLIVALTLNAN